MQSVLVTVNCNSMKTSEDPRKNTATGSSHFVTKQQSSQISPRPTDSVKAGNAEHGNRFQSAISNNEPSCPKGKLFYFTFILINLISESVLDSLSYANGETN